MGIEQPGDGLRLHKFLAQAGLASRREAERLIAAGRVMLNGQVVTGMGRVVDPASDEIRLDGKLITSRPALTYLMLNKPEGYLVSRGDTHQRATVYELLPRRYHSLHPVGRLDGNSAGLLLLTNDGELTQRLLHPRHHVEKVYQVQVCGRVEPEQIAELRAGITLEEGRTQPAEIRQLRRLKSGALLEFRLREGKKRQIRRMCQAMGWEVESLTRLQLGPLALEQLPPGNFRELSAVEVNKLRQDAGLAD